MSLLPQIKKRGTLTQHAYQILRKAIIELELQPGQPLMEEELAAQLGVSRTPVRAAVNQLIYEGMIDIIPGRGTFVSELKEQQFLDLFAVRRVLEPLSVELSVQHATEEDLKELYRIVCIEKRCRKKRDIGKMEFLKSDIDFHLQIAAATKNTYLARQLEQIIGNSCRFTFAYTSEQAMDIAAEEHEDICRFIQNRDADGAKNCLLQHLADIQNRVTTDLQKAAGKG